MREKGRYKNVVKIGGVKKMREKKMREKNEGNFLHSLSSRI